MKKILTALTIIGLTYSGAQAQNNLKFHETMSTKVCRRSPNKKGVSCYNTKYSENFKVCKNNSGYVICGEMPDRENSTHPGFTIADVNRDQAPAYQFYAVATDYMQANPVMTAPQEQSYPDAENMNTIYGIGRNDYIHVNFIRVGNSVATDNRLPYEGLSSPQDDGARKNDERNINESTPMNMPPLTGRPVSK